MAPSLINISTACTSKIRLLNPFPTAISIRQDAIVGQAEPIVRPPKVLVDQESTTEAHNHAQVRQISFKLREPACKTSCIRNTAKTMAKTENTGVPDHLIELYERSTSGLGLAGKEKIANLLTHFQDTFSRDEWDIGLTNLTEHSIPTGNAAPIKQPPRRVPLAHP